MQPPADTDAPLPASTNFAKFQTRNPVVRRLIDRFYDRLTAIVEPLGAGSMLDAGCGEGETIARLGAAAPGRVAAVDLSAEAVAYAARRLPAVEVRRESVYELPFADDSFDLVLCLEVLEHLDEPARAVAELSRVARANIVVSVPHEPWFRLGSLLRGKHLRALGNHPEHVNHWDRASLGAFLEEQLEAVEVTRSFPWLLARAVPRRSRRSDSGSGTGAGARAASTPAAGRSAPG